MHDELGGSFNYCHTQILSEELTVIIDVFLCDFDILWQRL